MAFLTFKGGVHPYDGKELSKDKPITDYLPKQELVYPLSQHIGAPAKAIVAKGDHVLAGQKIAETGGFVSSPIHASVSGTVTAVGKVRNNMGNMVDAVTVENDGKYESIEMQKVDSLDALSKEEIIKRIQDGGVVGMGGAGFPTHVKLSPKEPDKIEYVLVNGAECEPYLTSDYRRMMEQPELVVGGLKCMLKLFDNAKGCICIEDNKPDCVAKMTEIVKDEPRIEVKTLKTKYPQGAERCLINAVTERELNSSMLPADVGCVVDNVDTVCAICRAVMEGRPVIEKIVTVTGDGIYPENRIDFKPYMEKYHCSMDEVTERINSGFAEITYRIFKAEPEFKGLYTSGGDITVSVCARFNTAGLSLMDEVLPLAAYGQFLKGEFEGVHIITKGGSQGQNDAINRCITYLKEKLYI